MKLFSRERHMSLNTEWGLVFLSFQSSEPECVPVRPQQNLQLASTGKSRNHPEMYSPLLMFDGPILWVSSIGPKSSIRIGLNPSKPNYLDDSGPKLFSKLIWTKRIGSRLCIRDIFSIILRGSVFNVPERGQILADFSWLRKCPKKNRESSPQGRGVCPIGLEHYEIPG